MSDNTDFLATLPFIKCCCFLTFNVAWLVIGIVLWKGGTSQYGQVIENESLEWNKGAIVDLQTAYSSTCPSGYISLSGIFPGTKTYCSKSSFLTSTYTLGSCGKKSKGYTVYGMSSYTLREFDNQYFCVKVDKELNYHKLAGMRTKDAACSSGLTCGSPSDKNKRFCIPNTGNVTQCPPNSILINADKSVPVDSKYNTRNI